MDFKTRFQGKTSHITKDGGISDMVKQSTLPINKVEGKIVVSNPVAHQQLISYGSGFGDVGRISNQHTHYNESLHDSPVSQKTPDLTKDNIYLRGNNMGEAMRLDNMEMIQKMDGGPSIAMRMKQNRENAIKINGYQQKQNEDLYLYQANPYQGIVNSHHVGQPIGQYSDQQFWKAAETTSYSDTSNISQNNKASHGGSGSSTTPNQMISQNSQRLQKQQSKTRQSVDQQRHQNLAKLSKEILSPDKGSQKPPLNLNSLQQQSININSEQKQNPQIKRKNSYQQINDAPNQNKKVVPGQTQKQRATSVSNQNKSDEKKPKQQTKQLSTINKEMPISNNVRLTDMYANEIGPQVVELNGYNNPQFPFMQQFQNPNLSQEQIHQQIQMMQHQMMLLQQQQQLISLSHITEQQYPQNMHGFNKNQEVYRQFELADQKFQEKKTGKGTSTSYNTNIEIDKQNLSYKPYTQKDFNQVLSAQQSIKLGGLGANIGGEEWEKAKRKQEAIQEYARNIKMQTQIRPLPQKKVREVPKEKTAREKAKEFAKNVPKPKVKAYSQEQMNEQNQDLVNIQEEEYDQYGNTIVGGELLELNQKHDMYSQELEKIKAMMA